MLRWYEWLKGCRLCRKAEATSGLGASEDIDNSATTSLHASTALDFREMLLLLRIPIMNIPISRQHDQHSQEPNDRAPTPAI